MGVNVKGTRVTRFSGGHWHNIPGRERGWTQSLLQAARVWGLCWGEGVGCRFNLWVPKVSQVEMILQREKLGGRGEGGVTLHFFVYHQHKQRTWSGSISVYDTSLRVEVVRVRIRIVKVVLLYSFFVWALNLTITSHTQPNPDHTQPHLQP